MALRIGITGHKHLLEKEQAGIAIENSIQDILRERNAKRFEAYSALAVGADTLFAEASLKLGGDLHVILPFDQLVYRNDFESKIDQDKFLSLLKKAKSVQSSSGKKYVKSERTRYYLDCGKSVVDNCDILIAAWDQQPAAGVGGTADVVAYANTKDKQVTIIPTQKSTSGYTAVDIANRFADTDAKAKEYKGIYDRKWKQALFFSYMAALFLVFATVTLKGKPGERTEALLLGVLELTCVVAAFSIIHYLKKNAIKEKRIAYRRQAELMRTLHTYYSNNIPLEPIFARNANVEETIMDLEYIFSEKSAGEYDLSVVKPILIQLCEDQIQYHKGPNRIESFEDHIHKVEHYITIVKWSFLAGVCLHVIYYIPDEAFFGHGLLGQIIHYGGMTLTFLCPPTYALFEAIKYFNEWERLKTSSEDIIMFFEEKIEYLKEDISADSFKRVAFEIRKEMDRENRVWEVQMESKEMSSVI